MKNWTRPAVLGLALAALAAPAFGQGDGQSGAMPFVDLGLRWMHVLFGILWIGHLYFFNFVQAGFEGKLDGPTKKLVVPELRPRALFWFRWGAMWTLLTGIGLMGIVYYMGMKPTTDALTGTPMAGTGWSGAPGVGYALVAVMLLVMFFVYDVVTKKLGAFTPAGLGVNLALYAGLILAMNFVGKFSGRALFIHAGATFGIVMAMNVWMRIWPAQRKIITAIKNGEAPDKDMVAMAGGRSRHNTYMSVPLLLFMVSNHYPTVYGGDMGVVYLFVFVAAGFGVAKLLFGKAVKVTGF